MGFKRFLKKTLIPGYNTLDMVKKISENGIVDGLKEKMKEDCLEDTPIISHIYNAGKYEGKKEGYIEASYEYEEKLIKQANEFLNKSKDYRNQTEEYEQLLNDYEKYIDEMIQKNNLSEQEMNYMNHIMIVERQLIGLNSKESNYSNNVKVNSHNYDERGFIKNTSRHKNGTKYDDEGYDKFGYDKSGYDKNGLDKFGKPKKVVATLTKYDERGFIKNTAKHRNGTKYDDEGYDKFGYDKSGYDKNGLDKFGKPKKVVSILTKYDKRGFIKNTAKHRNGTKYDDEGYDKFGYGKDGYDKNRLDKFGHPIRV